MWKPSYITGQAPRWLLRSWQLICLIGLCGISFAQTAIIKGRVKDEETNLPLATIVLPGHKILTNATGEFSVSLDPGTHKILITHTGYQPLEQTVTLHAGETRSVQFLMIRNEGLNDVIVLGSRSEIHRSRLNTTVPIDVLLSKHLEHTYQPSLIQMMNYAVPSINTSRQHLTDPITLRGLSPDHLLILLNGSR